MTEEKKPLKVEFAPGAFDNFDGTQEELDEMIAEITRMAETGELVDNGHELTEEEWNELPDEVKIQIAESYGIFEDMDEEEDFDNLQVNTDHRKLH